MRAKLEYPPKERCPSTNPKVAHLSPCTTSKCHYCPLLNTSGRIISTYTGRSYSSKIRVDCKSSNLIYCITCKHCSTQYVGQTKRRLMDRFQGHLYNITSRNVKNTIGHHFNQCGISDLEIHIVDFIHAHPESPQALKLCRTIERNWQHRLRTIAPQGLNIQD